MEMTPLSGKKTCLSGLSASMRTCSLWQRTCSSSGMSRLRSRDGRASKSRLRGEFDEALMLFNRAYSRLFQEQVRCEATNLQRSDLSQLGNLCSAEPLVSIDRL